MSQHDLLTVSEVAEYLRITERTTREMIKSGKLPAVKLSKEWRIKRADVEKLLDTEVKQ